MNLTNKSHAIENAAKWGLFWVCFWALMGSQKLETCDSGSHGMGKIGLWGRMGIGIN